MNISYSRRLLRFVFTFINFRTGIFVFVLYFLDRYFMVGNSLLGALSYVHCIFKWNSAVGIYLYERMKMHETGNGTEYLRACQPVRFWLSFWFDVHHFLASHRKGKNEEKQRMNLEPFVFICESCFGRKPVEYLVVLSKQNKDGQKDAQ